MKPNLVGDTPAMVELYKMIGRLSKNDVPALFVGEPGTGKSLAIAMLHDSSARGNDPLVHIDCTLPAAALEGALFGDAIGTLHLADIEALPAAAADRGCSRGQRCRSRALDGTAARARARVHLRRPDRRGLRRERSGATSTTSSR